MHESVHRRALALHQDSDHPLYLFALRPAEVLRIAGISRVGRSDEEALVGYQRDKLRQHVDEIQAYLDEGKVLFPNAIILAFNDDLPFERSRGPKNSDGVADAGRVEIRFPREGETKPAWIVDGQQRALALAATTNQDLAVPVAAFVRAGLDIQRDQFLRVNNARPLPRALVTELLPDVETFLPRKLAARKLPSAIADALNRRQESPFYGLIKRPSSSAEERASAIITDTSVVEMIKPRLNEASGCLFVYRNVATGETDTDAVVRILFAYWSAVREVFPDAWGLPPTRSRLMHGAGIRAMGNLMDAVVSRLSPRQEDLQGAIAAELRRIAPVCRWTEGAWEDLNLAWDRVENTPRHIKLLSNHLAREYALSVHGR